MSMQADAAREFAVLSGAVSTAMIDTEDGLVPLDWIAVGDRVLTRDAGYQPVRWIACTPVDNPFLRAFPEVSPVTVPADQFGEGCPSHDLILSPSQLLPLSGVKQGEVLVSADVVGDPIYPECRSRREKYTYVNVLLDEHHLVRVEGAWMGSLFTADLGSDADDSAVMTPLAPILDRAAALTLWAGLAYSAMQRRA